jgi:hypothetical protein
MAKPTLSNSVISAPLAAPANLPGDHLPQFGHRMIGGKLLDLALDPGLRRYSTKIEERSRMSRCSSVLPGQSPPTALRCTPAADHVVGQDRGILLVGGDGGDDPAPWIASSAVGRT